MSALFNDPVVRAPVRFAEVRSETVVATGLGTPREAQPASSASHRGLLGSVLLAVGCLALVAPTLVDVAREAWSTEQGAHGPIVLFTGAWLAWRLWPAAQERSSSAKPGILWGSLAILLPAFLIARITRVIEVEGYIMYATVIVALYGLVGGRAIRVLWFPLIYLAFIFPPPDTLVAAATLPMKTALSDGATRLLALVGYPIGSAGVTIYVGQYQLLVAEACSGLNSIISLSAISLFYIYMRHQADWRYAGFLVLSIIPIALLANFVRVLILILLTYHAGEATAQGFLHSAAGLATFVVALIAVILFDHLAKPVWDRLMRGSAR